MLRCATLEKEVREVPIPELSPLIKDALNCPGRSAASGWQAISPLSLQFKEGLHDIYPVGLCSWLFDYALPCRSSLRAVSRADDVSQEIVTASSCCLTPIRAHKEHARTSSQADRLDSLKRV